MPMTSPRPGRQNRLASETSPYLLQHAENPVDWYPWGPEALALAKSTDRPILLSIGYAACHWCHVMERESFENDAIAALMNEHFVCIKVDREERPDLDDIYMAATMALAGSGGWPMTVFLAPDQRPFFAGTYFPPDDRYGRPGFRRVLEQLSEAWKKERPALLEQADSLTRHVREQSRPRPPLSVGRGVFGQALEDLWQSFDREYGGFGAAPKFPPAHSLMFLLRHYRQTGDMRALEMVLGTLNGMHNGGMYDHLGGGFARYSTDARWLVPHFEKMLYDNASLVPVYLEAYQVTGRPEYLRVARETLDYVVREMQGEAGGYFSATDADSEGEEGKFFVWTVDQVAEVLEPEAARRFCAFYDVSPEGNWEGTNVLNTPRSLSGVAAELGIETSELAESLEQSKASMYRARLARVPPLCDDKVLTAHNGLMLGAMAFGYQVLGEPRYLESARRAAAYLWRELRRPDGGLYRTARAGVAHLAAYLEDYAYSSDGLVTLYEASGDPEALERALGLGERMLLDFADDEQGGFFQTAHAHEALIARTREGHDGALPAANALAARALLRLGRHFGRDYLVERAEAAVRTYGRDIARAPRAFASTLGVIDMALEAPLEVVTVGSFDDPRYREFGAVLHGCFLPNKLVAQVDPGRPRTAELSPLTRDKTLLGGAPAAYLCENFTCQTPLAEPGALRDALALYETRRRAGRRSELAGPPLTSAADGAATLRLKARGESAGLTRDDYRELGDTGLWLSRLGFGAYRVGASEPEHQQALRRALELGINLIDTAPNYMDGDSERIVGSTLGELSRDKRISREEIVVVSKLGYLAGPSLAEWRREERSGEPLPELSKLSKDLWYSLCPTVLSRELQSSLERLGLRSLDVCLLHNPEFILEAAAPDDTTLSERRDAFYGQLTRAFGFLEEARRAGKLRYYGVSSNTLGRAPSDPLMTDAARLLAAAEAAGGSQHGFRVLELPLNLYEPAASALKNTGPDASQSALEFAAAHGLGVLTNRPLTAFMPTGISSLIDPPGAAADPDLPAAFEAVERLETRFAEQLAPAIRAPEGALPASALFSWAPKLRQVASELTSLAEYDELVERVIAPRVQETTRSLNRAFGVSHPAWSAFRDAYHDALKTLIGAVAASAAHKTRVELDELRALCRAFGSSDFERLSFVELALAAVRQHPHVTSALVGMRRPAYVDQAIASLRLTAFSDVVAAFAAIAGARVDGGG